MLEKAEKEVELRKENLRVLKGKLDRGKIVSVDENANETIEAVCESLDGEQVEKVLETGQSEVIQSLEGKKEEEDAEKTGESVDVVGKLKSDAIKKKWRVLGLKVRVGVTPAVERQRKVNDPNSFMEKEFVDVKKEEDMDLEGNCSRKKTIRKKWRKSGIRVGCTQG